ncbi:MAG TPA: DUF3048 domain-containing protein [Nitriliruptorales bacterium]
MTSSRTLAAGLTLVAVAAVAGALSLARDSDPASAGTAVASPSPSPSPSPDPTFTAPLTGVEGDDPTVLERPVVAVKIENSRKARPQSGLEVADVVYEELTEGGITRFVAVYQSRIPATVGPVRSGRLVDAQVVPAYRGVLAISGAREDVLVALRRVGVPLVADDGRGTIFYRERSRSAPSNLYAAGADLFGAARERSGAARPAWRFADEPPAGASACPPAAGPATPAACTDPGASLTVRMSGVSSTGWEYDEAAGLYRRVQDGEPHLVTGAGRIGAANVLAIGTDIGPGPCCDPAGNPMTATRVTGQGSGVLLRDGQRYEITWSKPSPTSHFEVRATDGRPIPFKPGPTWVMLAPASGIPGTG